MATYDSLLNSTFSTRDLNYEAFHKEALALVADDFTQAKWEKTVKYPNTNPLSSIPARHRGPRESQFFITTAQAVMSLDVNLKYFIIPLQKTFKTRISNLYPLNEVIADIQHTRAQLEFYEWINLKLDNLANRWY